MQGKDRDYELYLEAWVRAYEAGQNLLRFSAEGPDHPSPAFTRPYNNARLSVYAAAYRLAIAEMVGFASR